MVCMGPLLLALAIQTPSADPWARLASLPDTLSAPPAPRPQPRAAMINRRWWESSHGVGYLRPVRSDVEAFDWFRDVILPLYRAPGEQPFAWLARGWVYRASPGGRWKPYTAGGWLGIMYDGPVALQVYEIRPNGWFRFRYAAPDSSDEGTAWVHESHLGLGVTTLKLVTWESHFLKMDRPTFFSDSARHAVFAAPDSSSAVVGWLERKPNGEDGAYGVSALEVRGEWMRVRVQWPYPVCGQTVARTAEGWIRWKTPDRGPRLGGVKTC